MKSARLILLFGAALSLSSCFVTFQPHTTKLTPVRADKNVSYVVLDNGDSVGGDMRKRDPLFSQSKFQFGDSTYKAKEVTFYQHKGTRYMTVNGGKNFAYQTLAGPINMYETLISVPTADGRHSVPKKVSYLQGGGPYQPLLPFNYKNTRQLIPQSPELDKFVQTRKVIRIINWSSAGMLLGGFAALVVSDNATVKYIGAGAVGVGLVAPLVSLGISAKNSKRPFQAVLDYNQRAKRKAAKATAVR